MIDDRKEASRELSGWYGWKFVPDPTLTRLVYVRDYGRNEEAGLVLVNLENGQTLWELKRFSPGDRHIPIWSPDGSQVAVISDDFQDAGGTRWELYTVNRDGQATQWIDMKSKTVIHSSLWADGPEWSPNERYIAFFSDSLYILDMVDRWIFDLCIPMGEWSGALQNAVIWSPDSKQILIQRDDVSTIIIDLESYRAAPLVDDLDIRPIGWLANPAQAAETPAP
jgi:Tol biopolymer transport system component